MNNQNLIELKIEKIFSGYDISGNVSCNQQNEPEHFNIICSESESAVFFFTKNSAEDERQYPNTLKKKLKYKVAVYETNSKFLKFLLSDISVRSARQTLENLIDFNR